MSYALTRRLPPAIEAELRKALAEAEREPHRRSEILGTTALGLAARSAQPEHAREAPILRQLAEEIAEAAMAELPGPATRDDFQETLEEFDQAHEQYAGDQDVLARADDLHDLKKTAKHGARVSIAPLSWGAGATLGRTGRFKFAPTQNDIKAQISQAATLAYWQGEPHESQAITIDLAPPADGQPTPFSALPDPSLGGTDVSSRPRGIISFGADGAITKVAVDAGFGARLTVTGNYVAIQLHMDPPMSGADAGVMSFTGSIGAFASPSAAPVFWTAYLDALPNNAITDGRNGPSPIQRPSHATHLLPILSSATSGNVLLSFYGQGGLVLLTQFLYPIGQLLLPIPLPSEVQYLTIQNLTGGPANFRVPFQLAL